MQALCEAVLFDNDGVLVDSHEQVDAAWRRLAGEFGLDVDEVLAVMAGVRAVDTLDRFLPPERRDAAVTRLEELEVAAAAATKPLRGATALLKGIPRDRWTIVTSGSRRLAEARWAAAGIPTPNGAITADDVTNGKPHPEPYLAGAATLDVEPARCIVVEDAPNGARSASRAGMRVVAVGPTEWDVEPLARICSLADLTVQITSHGDLLLETPVK